MSAELHPDASAQSINVGGSKPLYHFMKGQPKTTGSAVLVLGFSFFIISVMTVGDGGLSSWVVARNGVILGILFILCGILYIVTEHKTTKKTVTISLALTIVTLLSTFWTILQLIPNIHYSHHIYSYHDYEDNVTETTSHWSTYHQAMSMAIDVLYLFYCLGSMVVFIAMSALAGAALRSSKTQAVVVMKTAPTEMPVE
ncbi:unnamed protein product [Tetraodon nigroviridis]|uniref:(spotted green pufferfish) hypothetical protein n=1 Tax=Tetraodon nigroviridis TaxID=99883 RepID=Q4T2Y3_TETNG|nr:unnamed protein product [Tetraodon nigroviridis]